MFGPKALSPTEEQVDAIFEIDYLTKQNKYGICMRTMSEDTWRVLSGEGKDAYGLGIRVSEAVCTQVHGFEPIVSSSTLF